MKGRFSLKKFYRRAAALALSSLFFASTAFAAVTGTRFHSGSEHDRLVFDLDAAGSVKSSLSADGRTLTLELPKAGTRLSKAAVRGKRIKSASYTPTPKGLRVVLHLAPGMRYEVKELKAPLRIFVDVKEAGEKTTAKPATPKPVTPKPVERPAEDDGTMTFAPGLVEKKLVYTDASGKQISAWILTVDHTKYRLALALANGKVPGTATVSKISDDRNAAAAINASYFSTTGELIGITKIDGRIAGTTYYTRSAMGLKSDGSIVFGTISYDGKVTMGGRTLGISGVDAERMENGVVLYNRLYGRTTGTNAYGMEYTVENGKVTDIQTNDSPIPSNGVVVSVHGSAKDAFSAVSVGDPVTITQDIGAEWENIPTIIGVGPRLVEDGTVHVTADEEDFPADIRVGRAPRSAVGVTKTGDYILAVADGRQSHSAGLTLTAWAELLKNQGAYNAINLDGGGSSELVIGGDIQNSPSDGHERRVGDAIVVLPR